jgi:hypothetical protein
LKKSNSELDMGGDITRRNLIHDAGLAALGLSLHFEFRELPECLQLAECREKRGQDLHPSNTRLLAVTGDPSPDVVFTPFRPIAELVVNS